MPTPSVENPLSKKIAGMILTSFEDFRISGELTWDLYAVADEIRKVAASAEREATVTEARKVIAELKSFFANAPLDQRLTGWEWLTMADTRIAAVLKLLEPKQ